MPKIGFSLRKLDRSDVKGMLLGLRIEAGYIPVISCYAKHQLGLLRKVAKSDYADDRAIYKSLPCEIHKRTEDTDQFFFDRYGITATEAEDQLLASLTGNLTDCVQYDLLDVFTQRDL